MPDEDEKLDQWYKKHMHPHEPLLRSWLRQRLHNESDVEDIVQEAMIRIIKTRRTRIIVSPKAFLFTIARNLVTDHIRRQNSRKACSVIDFDLDVLANDKANAYEQMVRDQDLEIMTKAIQALPTRCRQIFTLRKVYGLSQKQIADKMGISVNTVSAQLTIGACKCSEYGKAHRDV